MKKEVFECKVGFTVSEDVFDVIHDMWMDSQYDADTFCKKFSWEKFASYSVMRIGIKDRAAKAIASQRAKYKAEAEGKSNIIKNLTDEKEGMRAYILCLEGKIEKLEELNKELVEQNVQLYQSENNLAEYEKCLESYM